MLRVAYFSPVSDLKGGAETSLVDLLNNPSVEAVLIVPSLGDLSDVARDMGREAYAVPLGRVAKIRRPVRIGNVLPAMRDWFRAARTLRSIARKNDFDIVHSNGLKAHFVACLCRLLGGPPVVIHIHDIPLQRRERVLWRTLGMFADLVLIVSRPCWPSKGELPSNVKVLFNGLDTSRLPILSSEKREAIVVGFCGRLHPYKGVDHLIRWIAYVRDVGFDLRLVIRGEGAPEHAWYLKELLELVASLNMSELVTFEGKKHGLGSIYNGLDLVVVPSVVPDALPRSILEAMGLGLLVAAFPSGGIVDQINHGTDGFLVEDQEQFLKVVDIVANDPVASERIRSQARLKVKDKFTIEKMYADLRSYYDYL
ncbi:glycosyltransferase family 4 protein [Agrobacterium tumefaciens]|uniref:glycosyltransferase family 4 protein n=1 Tax=Agrobacterium tumefaciens TaxID=358 RepID=UPI00220C8D99|nr:glycosyltransferase family 4 protein [Agrobacterium tumefaciens]